MTENDKNMFMNRCEKFNKENCAFILSETKDGSVETIMSGDTIAIFNGIMIMFKRLAELNNTSLEDTIGAFNGFIEACNKIYGEREKNEKTA